MGLQKHITLKRTILLKQPNICLLCLFDYKKWTYGYIYILLTVQEL